jgi:adenine-specific DNA-methyltransferase
VDSDDQYKHSKWLAFMERRLKIAQELLKPGDSVLIATIDENELHRFGLLLEQVFEGADIQMVTTVISAKGAVVGQVLSG